MSKKHNINLEWPDYDDRKKKKEDRLFFSCEEDWEVEYLIEKIQKAYPDIDLDKISDAIGQCCASVKGSKPRRLFVNCVMRHLGYDGDDEGNNPPPNPGPGPQNPPSTPGNRKVG